MKRRSERHADLVDLGKAIGVQLLHAAFLLRLLLSSAAMSALDTSVDKARRDRFVTRSVTDETAV